MNNPKIQNSPENRTAVFNLGHIILASVSLCALVVTFLTVNFNLDFQTKFVVFLATVFLYLAAYAAFYVSQRQRLSGLFADAEVSTGVFSREIETKLLALEEANEFFGASLKSADMFRLVTSRIKEIIPFAASALFIADENNARLKVVFADGENAVSLVNLETNSGEGLAGKTFTSRRPQLDEKLFLDKSLVFAGALNNIASAVSVPLFRGAEVFGALVLYAKDAGDFDADSLQLLEAVGTRAAQLFLSSFAFEKSLSNALTDALTNLPNERAFYLVLENKIAESQRFRELRPLTVLTVDVKNFNELNQKFGHAAGDRILSFVAEAVKKQLRQMDFLARSAGDEFLAVLPTADEQITREIVERVEKTFLSNSFVVAGREKIHLALNFGAATFWKDGETVGQLLQHARLRKQQSKSTEKSKVLWFPREFVN